MSKTTKFQFKVSEDDDEVAYLEMPRHPGSFPGVVKKTVSLRDLLDYSGPDLYFNFDENNVLIGVEILA